MTYNPEILPTNLGPSKLQTSQHLLVHYYKLLQLKQEILKLNAKEVLNENEIHFNLTLSTLQNIQNALTFCKLKTLHPSIISSK